MDKPRIVIADDHLLVLEGLAKMLANECDVIGVAKDGRQLLEVCGRLKPDVVLLDISMPALNGIEVARQINRTMRQVKLIFVTVHAEGEYVRAALRAGAQGYLLKQSAPAELMLAI